MFYLIFPIIYDYQKSTLINFVRVALNISALLYLFNFLA